MKFKPNTRFNADICFVTKVAWTVACGSLFYATFAPTLPPLCATAKAQMQVKRMLCAQRRALECKYTMDLCLMKILVNENGIIN